MTAPTVPDGDVPGFTAEDAQRYADAHQRDALDVAAEAIDDEAWPHEKPKSENQALYRLADKVRAVRPPRTTDR